MIRSAIHLALHVFVPGVAAHFFWENHRWKAWLIMVSTMLVDMDHFLATPMYDPNRCSMGFHPLHSYPAILLYALMTAFPKTRIMGTGLLIHMGLDLTDCLWMRWD